MASTSHKIAVGEKGQRTARSTNAYLSNAGHKDVTVCPDCLLIHRNKRWVADAKEGKRLLSLSRTAREICPACRRVADDNPAGIVALSGAYLEQNWQEIQNLINRVAEQSIIKNPLGRIMTIDKGKNGITVTTTNDKIAQKIGREIFKAHKGELIYSWSHDQQLVRVTWNR